MGYTARYVLVMVLFALWGYYGGCSATMGILRFDRNGTSMQERSLFAGNLNFSSGNQFIQYRLQLQFSSFEVMSAVGRSLGGTRKVGAIERINTTGKRNVF